MATQVSRPVHSFQCATVRASIWRNEGKRGAFHAITLSRIFMEVRDIRRAPPRSERTTSPLSRRWSPRRSSGFVSTRW